MDIINPNYLNINEQVNKNKNDILSIMNFYKSNIELEKTSTSVLVTNTNITDTYVDTGFIIDPKGLLFKIIARDDNIIYLSLYSDLQYYDDIQKFEFIPNNIVYSDNIANIQGILNITNDVNATIPYPIEFNLPIKVRENSSLILDISEDNKTIELDLEKDSEPIDGSDNPIESGAVYPLKWKNVWSGSKQFDNGDSPISLNLQNKQVRFVIKSNYQVFTEIISICPQTYQYFCGVNIDPAVSSTQPISFSILYQDGLVKLIGANYFNQSRAMNNSDTAVLLSIDVR